MSDTDVASTLYNVENPTSDFALFSTSDQRYFNVDPTLKCWLGKYFEYVFNSPKRGDGAVGEYYGWIKYFNNK